MCRYVPFQLHPIFVRNSAHYQPEKNTPTFLSPSVIPWQLCLDRTAGSVAQHVFRLSRSILSSLPDESGHLPRLHTDVYLVIAFVIFRPSHGRPHLRQSTLPPTRRCLERGFAVFTRAWDAQNLNLSAAQSPCDLFAPNRAPQPCPRAAPGRTASKNR